MTYRPDIDGLRGVAICAVILYHLDLHFGERQLFSGGFIGVDVFFVISGYLITSIILFDLKNDNFSFAKFYERRARRILPALFVVILASLPFAWLYMLPSAFQEYAGSVLSSLLFSSNFWFWFHDNYFMEPGALKPFLHTWSLSLEEQFYVLFPLLLIFLWRFARKHFLMIVILLFLISLLIAESGKIKFSEFNFYLLPARMWELLAGAILAKFEFSYGRKSNLHVASIMPSIGVLLLIYAFVFFDKSTLHPGFLTLIPIIGTMLLIYFGRQGELITNVLSSRPFVGVGLISYSLYLWHYPVFAFSRINNNDVSGYEKIEWVVVSVVLSIATYFFVERPFRTPSIVSRVQLSAALGVVFLFNVAVLTTGYVQSGNLSRYEQAKQNFLNIGREKGGYFTQYVVEHYVANVKEKPFANNNKPKLLIIGDSYSQDFYNVLRESNFLDGLAVQAIFIPKFCNNVPNYVNLAERVDERKKEQCLRNGRVGDKHINDVIRQADAVILASSWDEFAAKYVTEIQSVIYGLGVKNVLVVGIKQIPTITNAELTNLSLASISSLKKTSSEEARRINIQMRAMKIDHYLDLQNMICGNGSDCPVATPLGHLISFDGSHLTPEGAKYVGQLLKENQMFTHFWADNAQR